MKEPAVATPRANVVGAASDPLLVTTLPGPSPLERLRALARTASPLDEATVIALLDVVAREGHGSEGIDIARRLLDVHPDAHGIALRASEMCAANGDDDGALALLEPRVTTLDAAPAALMLAGELKQRKGDIAAAREHYEQVLVQDLDYPGALERVKQIEAHRTPQGVPSGATLLTDGATARGRYRIEQELGRGGAGIVFCASDLHLNRRVALKIYHRRGPHDRDRLHNEARNAARFAHPGIIRILDLDDTLFAISMELMPGGSIRAHGRKETIPLDTVVDWFRQTLTALELVHAHGIVHRDIKPGNLLLDARGRVVLTDFSIAMASGATPHEVARAGEGTLAYMPLEQRAGAPASPSADVYALGVTLRELLGNVAGETPNELAEIATVCTRREARSRPTVRWILDRL